MLDSGRGCQWIYRNAGSSVDVVILSIDAQFAMTRPLHLLLLPVFAATFLRAAPDDTDVVFRSDVSLVRVDVQVLDRDNRTITGLRAEDFVLRDEGRPQPIRNFSREDMPVDLLFLFDVSASMRPHVERIASAAHQALEVMGPNDRVGIMVFDRATRLRMPFRTSRSEVERELDKMLDQESFHGGTDITRAMVGAANYVELHARREARRAIVILTDDQTEYERDDAGVGRALEKADAVLSALIAPDAMANRGYSTGRGGTWGNGGGGLGRIILGPGGSTRRRPGGTMAGPHTRSAGTSEIARQSGGDSLPVDDASALETTLARIRQRYALHFLQPPDVRASEERHIDVQLADALRRRYPDAELRFRRTYLASTTTTDPVKFGAPGRVVADAPSTDPVVVAPAPAPAPALKRRPAISEPDGPRGPNPSVAVSDAQQAQPAPITQAPAATPPAPTDATPQQPKRGWRRVQPGDPPSN